MRGLISSVIATIWVCTGLAGAAWAQQGFQICLPEPIELPGFPTPAEPPDWFSGAPPVCSEGACSDTSDPRWTAAPLYPLKSGVTHVSFRALRGSPTDLYMQVRCTLNGGGLCTLGSDELQLGLGTANPFILSVRVSAPTCGLNAACEIPLQEFAEYRLSNGDFVLRATPPASTTVAKAHVWKKPNGWIVAFHIVLDSPLAALAVGAKLRVGRQVVGYHWPSCVRADCVECSRSGLCVDGLIPRSPATWAEVLDPCDGALVVDLASLNIGVQPGAAGPLVTSLDLSPGAINKFIARPEIGANSWPIADLVLADFRLADWGSTIGVDGPWTSVGGPEGSSVPTGEVAKDCASGACPLPPTPDQCLLVALNAGAPYPYPGQSRPLLFSSAAVVRCNSVVEASTVQRRARIDLRGVEALGDGPPDEVFFAIEAVNFPAPGARPFSLPLNDLDSALGDIARGVVPTFAPQYRELEGTVGAYRAEPLEARLTEIWPSLIVHPFFRTGRSLLFGESDEVVEEWEPMTPFGFYVRHEGLMQGLQFSLTDEEGNDLLKSPLRSFQNGSALVLLTVTAVEPDRVERRETDEVPLAPTCASSGRPRSSSQIRGSMFGVVVVALAVGRRRGLANRRQREREGWAARWRTSCRWRRRCSGPTASPHRVLLDSTGRR